MISWLTASVADCSGHVNNFVLGSPEDIQEKTQAVELTKEHLKSSTVNSEILRNRLRNKQAALNEAIAASSASPNQPPTYCEQEVSDKSLEAVLEKEHHGKLSDSLKDLVGEREGFAERCVSFREGKLTLEDFKKESS